MHQLQIGRPQATARLRRRLAPQRPHCEGSARNPVPAGHALTEQLNNAIDHSDGSAVTVSIRRTPLQLQLLVSDHGRGVFGRIAQRSQITEPRLAMFELSKARGRGLFFTSRPADVFDIHASDVAFQCRARDPRGWHLGRPAARRGPTAPGPARCPRAPLQNTLDRRSARCCDRGARMPTFRPPGRP